jgi:hypothetical protein
VSCTSCKDIEEKDGVDPDCKTGRGCLIPPLGTEEARVMELRAMLINLKDLTGPEAVLRMHGATRGDLHLLAAVEEEMRAAIEDKGWRV